METMSERQDHTLLWEGGGRAKCVCVGDASCALSCLALSVCDWTLIEVFVIS